MIRKLTVASLLILLTAQTPAPIEPDAETKRRALMLGYILNGESMVRAPHLGSIDVRGLLDIPDAPLILPPLPPREPPARPNH